METDLELNAKRLEVKNEITAGINKTPMARLFNITGSVVQKITRYPKPLPFGYCAAILGLMILLLGLLVVILFGKTDASTGINRFSMITLAETFLLAVILTYFNLNKVLVSLRDNLVDSITSSQNLSNLQQWLSLGWSSRSIKRFLPFYWVFFIIVTFFIFISIGGSDFGLLILLLVSMLLGGIGWYYVPLMLLLPVRLQFYQFKLYESDPARSEVIEDLSAILRRFTYGFVGINVLLQLAVANTGISALIQIAITVAFTWVPVTFQYFANQISIRDIISSSKRRTLNRIQAQIKEFHDGDITSKDNIETINRLIDYHERIRVTPNSGFNIESSLRFLNQMIIPFLGFLLANMDKVIDYIR